MKHVFLFVVGVALVAFWWVFFYERSELRNVEAATFEECAALGNPVMESYPRQCIDAVGNHFVEEIDGIPGLSAPSYVNASADDIVADIEAGATITSPLTITGVARGYWFFEASFPIVLTNWDGLIIAEGFVTATNDWMTTDFVPFRGTLTFAKPDFGERGTLILQRDNPSDLPENDAALEIPVVFE